MRTIAFTVVMALATIPSLANACNDHAPGTEPKHHAAGQPSSLVAGEVREVDVNDGTITLAHGRITTLRMRPMSSMVLKAGDATSIANLKPGDKVKFRVTVVGAQPTLMEIQPAMR